MSIGRPEAVIDPLQLEKLCTLQCTDEEIAAFFNVSTKTIQRRRSENQEFAETMERGKASGRISLRRAQYKAALGGNVTAQIWLGKQVLGQRDKLDVDHSGEVKTKAALPAWLLDQLKTKKAT